MVIRPLDAGYGLLVLAAPEPVEVLQSLVLDVAVAVLPDDAPDFLVVTEGLGWSL
jgi:hypothetical protein